MCFNICVDMIFHFLFVFNINNVFLFYLFSESYPMLLVANKVDLVHLRKVTEEQGKELAVTLKVFNEFL